MNEEQTQHKVLPQRWRKKGVFYVVDSGAVLVKRSPFRRGRKLDGKVINHWTIGSYQEESVEHRGDDIILADCTVGELRDLKEKANPRDKKLIEKILRKKEAKEDIPDDLKDITIPADKETIIRRRINAKVGIHIRWPWQQILILPLGEQKMDTPSVKIDIEETDKDDPTKKSVFRYELDTDYRFEITDPDKYAYMLNSIANEVGSKEARVELSKRVGSLLDALVSSYARTYGIQKFNTESPDQLRERFNFELAKIGNSYGIEITKFYVKKISFPQVVIESSEKIKKAAAEKAARIAKAQAEAEATRLEGAASAERQKMTIEKMLEALNVDPSFVSLPAEDKMNALQRIIVANTGKAIFTMSDGRGPAANDPTASLIAALHAYFGVDKGSKDGKPIDSHDSDSHDGGSGSDSHGSDSHDHDADKNREDMIRILSDNNLLTGKGTLDFDACEFIAKRRGEPIKKYTVDDLTAEDVAALVAEFSKGDSKGADSKTK